LAFDLVFAVLRLRSQNQLAEIQDRVSIAALSRVAAWAQNNVEHGLNSQISWQKTALLAESVSVAHADSVALQRVIETSYIEEAEEAALEAELLGINNTLATFMLRTANGQQISGLLANGFPRGVWPVHGRYMAALTRKARVSCSTGEETVRWMLNALTP